MIFLKNKKISILIIVLVLLNLFFIFYIIKNKENTKIKSEINKYPLIDPARTLTAQKHFFTTIQPLRDELKEIVANYEKEGHRIGVYFEYLNTGANISINQEERFWPASLSKMPTVFVVMKKIQDGEWKFSSELVLFEEDKDARFGELHYEVIGTKFTVEDLLKKMLIESDNTAHKMFVRNLTGKDYEAVIGALGMENLFDENYDITAKEYSRIFRALYSASYLNRENSQIVLDWLSQTNFDEFLGSGVPKEVKFSHKIGEEYQEVVFLDSGIVYVPDRPYLLTIMVEVGNGESIEKASEIMNIISKKSYEYVINY